MTFDDTIYKPGFLIENFRVAPQSAYFVHFNWLLRSFEERRLKVIGYERQAAGAGWRCMRFELPELHASADLRWTAFETDEFDGLARRLAESIRPDSPADCRRNPT